MENDAALERLCAACGISPQYHDIWGNVHVVSAASKRALLRAMGIAADGASDCDALLRDIEQHDRRRLLPPVQVVRESAGAPRIALATGDRTGSRPLRWTLTFEDGTQHAGDIKPSSLPQQNARRLFTLPTTPPSGYHRFALEGAEQAAMQLIVAPDACYMPAALCDDGRTWGPAAQIYALRSRRNWGIGDFTDLRSLAQFSADAGAGIIGVNPLHALYPANAPHASPYSPSSRMFLNVLYLDVEAIADFAECVPARELVGSAAFQARLAALRGGELIDYAEVANAKFEVLDLLYANFSERHLDAGSGRGAAFRTWVAERGEALHALALFDTLNEHFRRRDSTTYGWQDWPQAYRDPGFAEVQAFARDNRRRVTFFEYLQWQAELQLAAVGECIVQRGPAVGLYRDLALGADRGGAETWFDRALYALDASAGAPPDDFNLRGQDWGLPPFIPRQLVASAYQPFVALLRANMRHAGALRIDHVMGLARLFWVPRGAGPADGAYVAYPFQDLLGILALESRRNGCLVIGEDLGTVPDTVREALPQQRIFSYRPLYFERRPDGAFKAPSEYRPLAVVASSTHDLPTLAGWWRGSDLEARERLDLFPSPSVRDTQVEGRALDRPRLLQALVREGLWPADKDDAVQQPDMDSDLARAVQVFLARTPSKILTIQPEDVVGQIEQINLPASGDAYPNWRRRLPLALERWPDDQRFTALATVLREARGHASAARIPRATYRLQLNSDFTFSQAAELVPYLHALGVSHCYASPIFSARPGSRHGYDVTDHNTLNPELGGAAGFDALVTALRGHGMGLMLDIVPNHIGVLGAGNAWWLDVLEHGPASRYADFFDVDWQPPNDQLRGKVLLPVLGAQYGDVLESGDLKLIFDRAAGAFSVHYYEHRCPVDPREYPRILGGRIERLASRLGAGDASLIQLQRLIDAFGRLPRRDTPVRQRKAGRARDAAALKRRLAALCATSPTVAEFIAENVTALNGTPGDAQSFDPLDRLLSAQAWRLAYWRTASDDINYRRFFDVNDLAALSMERREVFDTTHRLVLDLVAQRKVDALRVDHVDGLYDPVQYCARLQQRAGGDRGGAMPPLPDAAPLPLYLTIEKITASYERLPERWPVHGTTGYRFANLVNGVFVDAAAAAKMTRIYRSFIGEAPDYGEVLHRSKHLIMNTSLAAELNMLANRARRIARMDRHTCDFTLNSLHDALAEVAACFPVYRTYVNSNGAADEDRRFINWAVETAKKRSRTGEISVLDFVHGLLTIDRAAGHGAAYREAVVAFAMKFQQFTAPVTAKGNEDTGFYRYHRLVSLNDVGGDPREFGISLAAFHAASQDRARNWPHTMLATSTHDSKRAEDVRTRIDALSEMPALWRLHLRRWRKVNRSKLRVVDGVRAPSANDEYLLYQTLIGVWPPGDADAAMRTEVAERVSAYMLKAVREAKLHSSWLNPNTDYEDGVSAFVHAIVDVAEPGPFLADFIPFQRQISRLGMLNSLALTLLKLTSPGVPDIYRGSELWDFSLVDPDNRRAVDFELRRRMLDDMQPVIEMDASERIGRMAHWLDTIDDGYIKLYLNLCALSARRRHEALFRDGDYLPLRANGACADHVCAFARYHQGKWSITAVPRLFAGLGTDGTWQASAETWRETALEIPDDAPDAWNDALTGAPVSCTPGARTLAAAELFARFPGALLFPRA